MFKALDAILVPYQLHPETEGVIAGSPFTLYQGILVNRVGSLLIGKYCAPQLVKEAGARQVCD